MKNIYNYKLKQIFQDRAKGNTDWQQLMLIDGEVALKGDNRVEIEIVVNN